MEATQTEAVNEAQKPREECESCGSTNTDRSATKFVDAGVLEFRMCYECGSGYTIGYEIAG